LFRFQTPCAVSLRDSPFRHVAAAAAAVALGMAGAAAAAERPAVVDMAAMPLDALLDLEVTGPSRSAQRMSDAAASVTVITADEIRALGYRTIAEALRSVRGVAISNDRTYSYIGVRGFYAPGDYNTRVLLLVDGNRVNDNLYDQAYVGSEAPIDIERVERIEFVPGQGSAVYGPNAFLGVINVVTKKPGAQGSGAGVTLAGGGERNLRASIAGADWLLQASRKLARGFDRVDPGLGTQSGTDGEARTSINLVADAGGWRFSALHSDRTKGMSVPDGTIYGDPRNVSRDTLTLLDLAREGSIGSAALSTRVFAGRYRFVGDYPLPEPDPALNIDDDLGRWWGAETRLAGSSGAHRWQVGAEYQRSTRVDFRNDDAERPDVLLLDVHGDDERWALYGEDRITLGERWALTAGGRIDHTRFDGSQFNPRLALAWRPAPAWVLKAIYGTAFRPPNAYERDYVLEGWSVRNPGLRAERVAGRELVAEWTPAADLRFTLASYHQHLQRLIVLQTLASGEYMQRNLGRLQMLGHEAEAQWQSAQGWMLRANYTRQHATGQAQDLFGITSPRQMAKLTAVLPLGGWGTLGLGGQAIARRGNAAGYGLANAQWSRAFGRTQVGVGVGNLFGRAHHRPRPGARDPGGAGAGRRRGRPQGGDRLQPARLHRLAAAGRARGHAAPVRGGQERVAAAAAAAQRHAGARLAARGARRAGRALPCARAG
jgi:outer membrane receptor protein involved in Fe transport